MAIQWNNLGKAYHAMGKYENARDFLEKALAICKKMLGDDHPYTKSAQESLDIVLKEIEE